MPGCLYKLDLTAKSLGTQTSTTMFNRLFTHTFLATGLSIEMLKKKIEVTDEQINARVEDSDLPELSLCFDNTEDYVEKLKLSPGEQTDVRVQAFVNGTHTGMKLALKLWKNKNPLEATFRALLLILLSLLKGDVAVQVCKYLAHRCK